MTFGDIKDILTKNHWNEISSNNTLLHELRGSAQYLELVKENKNDRTKRIYKNTLGNHYGETFHRVKIDGRYTYVFEDGTYVKYR